MSQHPDPLREELLRNEEYCRLHDQHLEFESRLHALASKVLNDDEQLEETTLKKKKLQVKDRMEAIARNLREATTHP